VYHKHPQGARKGWGENFPGSTVGVFVFTRAGGEYTLRIESKGR
jgi:hypothetical protein